MIPPSTPMAIAVTNIPPVQTPLITEEIAAMIFLLSCDLSLCDSLKFYKIYYVSAGFFLLQFYNDSGNSSVAKNQKFFKKIFLLF